MVKKKWIDLHAQKNSKKKNWCNNFDYNDRQCKNSVITKQCNSSVRWQKQTNKQTIWWSSRKKIVLEKVTFSEKFRAGFMIFQYSMKMKKKHSTSQQILQKHYKEINGQKMAKNGQKIHFYLLTFNEACLIHLTKISKKCQKYVICMLVVSQSCLLILIL